MLTGWVLPSGVINFDPAWAVSRLFPGCLLQPILVMASIRPQHAGHVQSSFFHQGSSPCPLHRKDRFLTSETPGKFLRPVRGFHSNLSEQHLAYDRPFVTLSEESLLSADDRIEPVFTENKDNSRKILRFWKCFSQWFFFLFFLTLPLRRLSCTEVSY